MADLISRLKLESGEFDSRIARATKGLLTMEKECRSVGGTLAILDKDQKEYIKSLGQMETVSQDARGKIGELTKAFTELSLQYKRLTDEEKQGDFGTALAGSLEQLKTRIRDGRAELEAIEQSVSQIGGSFDKLAQEIGIPADELQNMIGRSESAKQQFREYNDTIVTLTQAYNGLSEAEKNSESGQKMAAHIDELKGKAAQLKDAIGDTNEELKNLASDTSFTDGIGLMTRTIGSCAAAITAWTGDSKEMEQVIKELAKIGTTVAAVEQLTKAFQKQNLVLLKNPYVAVATAMAAVVVAAGKMLQKMRELDAVQKTLNEVQAKGREGAAQEVARIDALNNILHDNKRSLEERKTALEEIQTLVPEYHGALTAEGNLINDNTSAIDAYVDSLQRAAIAQAAFDRMVELQKQKMEEQVKLQKALQTLKSAQSAANVPVVTGGAGAISGMAAGGISAASNIAAAQSTVTSIEKIIAEVDEQIAALRSLVQVGDIKPTTSGGKVAKTPAVKTKTPDFIEPATRGVGMGGVEMSAFQQLQQSIRIKLADDNFEVDENSIRNLLTVAMQNGIDSLNPDFAILQEKMAEGFDIPDSEWQALADKINEKLKELNLDPIVLNVETGGVETLNKEVKQTTDHVAGAAQAFEALGNAMGQIQDPGAKVAGLIANAIASIASGYGQAVAQAGNGSAGGPWGWIAFAISGLATMISTIAAVKSATAGSYAEGGLVPGSSFSGDNLTASVNSGELILNRAQQGAIAGQLQGAAQQTVVVEGRISGKDILLSANNTNRAAGGSRGYYTKVK